MICCAGGGFAGEIVALLTGFERRAEFIYAIPRVDERRLLRRFEAKRFVVIPAVSHGRRRGLKRSPLFWAGAVRRCMRVLRRRRARLVIALGAAECLPLVVASRLLGVNVVFIETLTRVASLSRTGQIIYHGRLASDFLVQWPRVAETHPRARFEGVCHDLRHGRHDVF